MNHVTGVMEAIHRLPGVSGPMKDLCLADSMNPKWVSVCIPCVVAALSILDVHRQLLFITAFYLFIYLFIYF